MYRYCRLHHRCPRCLLDCSFPRRARHYRLHQAGIEQAIVFLPQGREEIPCSMMSLLVLVLSRVCDPSSELYIAEHIYERTALGDLLGVPGGKVNDDRLYRASDALLPGVRQTLRQMWGLGHEPRKVFPEDRGADTDGRRCAGNPDRREHPPPMRFPANETPGHTAWADVADASINPRADKSSFPINRDRDGHDNSKHRRRQEAGIGLTGRVNLGHFSPAAISSAPASISAPIP